MDSLTPAIRLTDIDFAYDKKRPILHGLNLTVADGLRGGLVGPNGCGKTTLFQIILGLLHPGCGTVEIYGEVCKKEKQFLRARRQVGLLFQDPNDQLFCPTVAEDIAFGPLNLGKTHDQARQIVEETLAGVGLVGYENRVTHKLSGGEKKLVALATVLAMKPRMLLLDEPLTGLDPEGTERVLEILKSLEIGYLIISHREGVLEKLADQVFRIENSQVTFL